MENRPLAVLHCNEKNTVNSYSITEMQNVMNYLRIVINFGGAENYYDFYFLTTVIS